MKELDPAQIADYLRQGIRRREIEPGATLNQKQLAQSLGVSRIPVREGLRILAGEGLVVLRPGQIARVVELTRKGVGELYDLRLALEPPLGPAIVDTASPADIRELENLVLEMEQTNDRGEWSTINAEFHRRMYAVVDRPHTRRLIFQVMNIVEPYSRVYVHLLHNLGRVTREHREMMKALHAADGERLRGLIELHLQGAQEGVLAELELWGKEERRPLVWAATSQPTATRAADAEPARAHRPPSPRPSRSRRRPASRS
jgi:DNA-binding GntR family transcriptional regulator